MKDRLPAFLQKLFPQKNAVEFAGIAIYPETIRIVKLKQVEQDWVCVLVKEYPVDRPEVTNKVLKFLITDAELEGVPSVIVIPSDKVESAQIELSDLPEVDIQASLPWKVKELVSIPPQDMICDYLAMDIQPSGQAPKAQVIATHRSYLDFILAPLHDAKVPVIAITTEQLVLARMQSTKDAAQLLFIQHTNTAAILLILKNQRICFARKIRGTDAVINMSEAEIVDYGAEMVAIEMQRSIDYFESQLKQPPIKNAMIALAGPNEALLAAELNKSLPVPSLVVPYSGITDETGAMSLSFVSAYGAALFAKQEGVQ